MDLKTMMKIAKANPKTYKIRQVEGGFNILRDTATQSKLSQFKSSGEPTVTIHRLRKGVVAQNHYLNRTELYKGDFFLTAKASTKNYNTLSEYIKDIKKVLPKFTSKKGNSIVM